MRDILALELLSCALFNSAMPCTGMIGLSQSVCMVLVSMHARVCRAHVYLCVCARATPCALRAGARGFYGVLLVLYLYMHRFFEKQS